MALVVHAFRNIASKIAVEIFQSGSKWWAQKLTRGHVYHKSCASSCKGQEVNCEEKKKST